MSKSKIAVEATINESIETVWDRYTNPEHIVNWNFANNDWCCPRAENDLRAGGKMLSRMEAKDGSFGFDFEAVYDEVMPNEKLVYTMTDGRQATVNFAELDSHTQVTVVFDAEDENSHELQQQGWQAILDNFKKYSESN
ncbi:MAG TPA: SRPBCC family protein [Pyrinomonadaceae bacterium]|nr:SRPBCC family protein [Pyrinomonadaceae bacterium]